MWKYNQFRELRLRIWFLIGFKNLKNQTILDKLLFCSDSLHITKDSKPDLYNIMLYVLPN